MKTNWDCPLATGATSYRIACDGWSEGSSVERIHGKLQGHLIFSLTAKSCASSATRESKSTGSATSLCFFTKASMSSIRDVAPAMLEQVQLTVWYGGSTDCPSDIFTFVFNVTIRPAALGGARCPTRTESNRQHLRTILVLFVRAWSSGCEPHHNSLYDIWPHLSLMLFSFWERLCQAHNKNGERFQENTGHRTQDFKISRK